MKPAVKRRTVDLSGYPDLVVIDLGMRVNAWYGLKTLLGFGPRIQPGVGDPTSRHPESPPPRRSVSVPSIAARGAAPESGSAETAGGRTLGT